MNFAALAATFAVIFLAELPDKTMFASLVLGTRFPPRYVFVGAAGAFAVHVVLAVAVGQAFSLLPRTVVDAVVAALFAIGAALLLFGKVESAEAQGESEGERAGVVAAAPPWRVMGTAFTVVLLAEFGDLTQITTANLAARYDSPIAVGIGAVLALWAVAAIAVTGGRALVRVVPLVLIRRIAGVLILALAAWSAFEAVRA